MGQSAVALLADEDVLRARFWGLLGALLAAPPSPPLLATLRSIAGDPTPIGNALGELAEAARSVESTALEDEFHHLFIGLARGELVPYASYYLTGFLNEKPLALLRADLAALGVALNDEVKDPEDHMAILAETMQGLIDGTFGPALSLPEQRHFFATHIAPWAGKFFSDLENCPAARFYRSVGKLGRLFLAVEAEAFAMID